MAEQVTFDDFSDSDFDEAIMTPEAGCYHVQVEDVETYAGNNNDKLQLVLRILSPGPYQGGKMLEQIPMDASKKWARQKRYHLILCCRVMTIAQMKQPGCEVDYDELKGKQFLINLEAGEYQGRATVQTGFRDHYFNVENKGARAKYKCVLKGEKPPEVSSSTPVAATPPPKTDASSVPF